MLVTSSFLSPHTRSFLRAEAFIFTGSKMVMQSIKVFRGYYHESKTALQREEIESIL